MSRTIQFDLNAGLMLSIAENDGRYEIALLEWRDSRKGYYIVDSVPVTDITEMFDLIYTAYKGDVSVFSDHYYVDLDQDNEPELQLVVDNDWPKDRADD